MYTGVLLVVNFALSLTHFFGPSFIGLWMPTLVAHVFLLKQPRVWFNHSQHLCMTHSVYSAYSLQACAWQLEERGWHDSLH